MTNAPFSDNLDPQDLKLFTTYAQVQAIAMTTLRKENERLREENDGLKKEAKHYTMLKNFYNLATDNAINEQLKKMGHDSFISDAALKRIDEHDTRIAKLEAALKAERNHEYEGSERWSPDAGDEVYRDGKWTTVTKSKHPDDDEHLIAEAKLYYGMSNATWISLGKIAQVALMRHYNKED